MVSAEQLRDSLYRLEGEPLERLLLRAAAMDAESRRRLQREHGAPFLARTQRLLELCLSSPSLYPALYLFLLGDTGPDDCFESFPDGALQLDDGVRHCSREGYAKTYRVRVLNSAHLNLYYRELRRRYATHPRYHAVEVLMVQGLQSEATLSGLCGQLAYEEGDLPSLSGLVTLVLYALRALHPTHAARLLLANEPHYASVSRRYADFLDEFLPRDATADDVSAWREEQDRQRLEVAATLTDEHPYGPPLE